MIKVKINGKDITDFIVLEDIHILEDKLKSQEFDKPIRGIRNATISIGGPLMTDNVQEERKNIPLDYDDLVRTISILDKYDGWVDDFYFSVEDGKIVAFIRCSDRFWWGSSDLEPFEPDDIDILSKAYSDIDAVEHIYNGYAYMLYCCRKRNMRPQGAAYPKIENSATQETKEAIFQLFHDCGPEREVGFGNPYAPGEYPERSGSCNVD